MIVLTCDVGIEDLISKIFEIGVDKILMVVPEILKDKILFKIFYKVKI